MRRRTFFGAAAALISAGSSSLAAKTAGVPAHSDHGSTDMAMRSPAGALDLKHVGRQNLVRSMLLRGDTYVLTMGDGSELRYVERDLRVKTDASCNGPLPGVPALIKSGMSGDRAYVVFATPNEISAFITG